MCCESRRRWYPIRGYNVRTHAKQGVSAVAASRHAIHDIGGHHIAAILPKVSAVVAIAPEIMFVRHAITPLAHGGDFRLASVDLRTNLIWANTSPDVAARCGRQLACWLTRNPAGRSAAIRGSPTFSSGSGPQSRVVWASSISYRSSWSSLKEHFIPTA